MKELKTPFFHCTPIYGGNLCPSTEEYELQQSIKQRATREWGNWMDAIYGFHGDESFKYSLYSWK